MSSYYTILETEVGPLILPKEADRVVSWIKDATAAGATLATGGNHLSETTVAPSILVEPPVDARVSKEEVFGPITCVYGFTDLDGAITHANSSRSRSSLPSLPLIYRRRSVRRSGSTHPQ